MDDSTIDEIARVRARLDLGEPRDLVLAQVGRTDEAFRRDEEAVIELLADDVDTGRTDRVRRFQDGYDALRGPRDEIAPRAEIAPMPIAEPPPQAAAVARQDVTSASANINTPAPPALGMTAVDETALLPGASAGQALPFLKASELTPAMIEIGRAQPAAPLPAPVPTGTREISRADLGLPSVPFATKGLPLTTGAIDRAQLGLAAVPFAGSNPAPSPRTAIDPVVQSNMTVLASDTAIDGPVLPFVPEDDLLPLEKYAQITALLTKEGNPERTFKRLGIEPTSWLGTVRAYSKRFNADPALGRQFDALVAKLSR